MGFPAGWIGSAEARANVSFPLTDRVLCMNYGPYGSSWAFLPRVRGVRRRELMASLTGESGNGRNPLGDIRALPVLQGIHQITVCESGLGA